MQLRTFEHAALLAAIAFSTMTTRAQSIVDPTLRVQTYTAGLSNPTGAVFLDDAGTALVTQKDDGKVLLVRDRKVAGTALDLPVANDSERGLLGIALSPSFASDKLVYLYHTAAGSDGGAPISNKVDRWRWDGSKLVFDRKLIDLPVSTGPNHDGGKLAFDSKRKVLVVIGDLNLHGRTQNFEGSGDFQRTGAILRIQPNGRTISTNPFATGGAKRVAQDDIYAYGIRNSFGLAVDPVTGTVWDSENGPDRYDEINRVAPGFNSGWRDIMGPRDRNGGATGRLVSLTSRARYSDPEFSWSTPVAPTDVFFMLSSKLGSSYRNDMFVGDVKTGSIFHFDLSTDRNSLVLGGALSDLVADNSADDFLAEQEPIVFGSGFGTISDLLSGPGGMFALSLSAGKLYRITQGFAVPHASAMSLTAMPEPSGAYMLFLAMFATGSIRRRREV